MRTSRPRPLIIPAPLVQGPLRPVKQFSKGPSHMDLEVVPSASIPIPTKGGDGIAIGKAVADLIGDESPSHSSASHTVNVPYLSGSDDIKPLADGRDPSSSGVACRDVVSSADPGAVPSEANSGSGTRSILLTNYPSPAVGSIRTAVSTSPAKSGFGGIKRSGLHKKPGVRREPKAIKKPEKTSRWSKAAPSLGKIKIKIFSSTVASTAGAAIGALSVRDVPVVEIDDDSALAIPPRCFPSQDST